MLHDDLTGTWVATTVLGVDWPVQRFLGGWLPVPMPTIARRT